MQWVLIIGMAITAIGVLAGLYLPFLVVPLATPDKMRRYAIIGAVLVIVGCACEIVAVLSIAETELEPQEQSEELAR